VSYVQDVLQVLQIATSVDTMPVKGKGKGKVIPLQAWCGPEGGYRYSSTLP